jgi:hypothetical protein
MLPIGFLLELILLILMMMAGLYVVACMGNSLLRWFRPAKQKESEPDSKIEEPNQELYSDSANPDTGKTFLWASLCIIVVSPFLVVAVFHTGIEPFLGQTLSASFSTVKSQLEVLNSYSADTSRQ